MKRIVPSEFPAMYQRNGLVPRKGCTVCNGDACLIGVLYVDLTGDPERGEIDYCKALDALMLVGYEFGYLMGLYRGFEQPGRGRFEHNYPIDQQLGRIDGEAVNRLVNPLPEIPDEEDQSDRDSGVV